MYSKTSTPRVRAMLIALAVLSITHPCAQAQNAPAARAPQGPSPEMMRQIQEVQKRYEAMPDMPGTGPYPAIKEAVAALPNHVIYRPRDSSKLGEKKLGILAWGNGGCSDDGASARLHLLQIASHGYIAIASGTIKSGPGVTARAEPPRGAGGGQLPPPATRPAQLTEAIDWALGENARSGSALYGRVDPKAIAVAGWSCGGLQALQVASDPRVRTVIIHNSGIFNEEYARRMPSMDIGKSTLKSLHSPVLYLLGGPSDIAYDNGMDDFRRIEHVPAVVANLDVGHGGTFYEPNGGKAALVAIAWLDWQLKGDQQASTWFSGSSCRLCTGSEWKIDRKRLD